MKLFLDSSALAKRYLIELGASRVDELLEAADELGLAVLTPTEVVSALVRRLREKDLTEAQYQAAKKVLLSELSDATEIEITQRVLDRAVFLLEQWPLRSSDALQIASAAEWECELFASADAAQCKAAAAYGLTVERIANS